MGLNFSSIDKESEKSLLERLRNGEKGAFEEMISQYGSAVFRQIRIILKSSNLAEDAFQEVFLKISRNINSVRGQNLFSWILSITHNFCLDELRKMNRAKEIPTDFSENDFSAQNQEFKGDLPDCLEMLSSLEREVVLLRIVDELNYEEISRITGFAEGTLRNAFSRGLKRARERYSQNGM